MARSSAIRLHSSSPDPSPSDEPAAVPTVSQGLGRKVAFYGNFGRLNLGNECTLQAALSNLQSRLPDHDRFCVCTYTEDVTARHAIPAVPIRRVYRDEQASAPTGRWGGRLLRPLLFLSALVMGLIDAAKALDHTDLLVFAGTGMLEDCWGGSLTWPLDILLWTVVARLKRCRVGFLSIGVGPIHRRLARWMARTALRLANYVSYRDGASKAYAESTGCDTTAHHIFPDAAFSLPTSMFAASSPRPDRVRVVGVGVMDYFGPYDDPDEKRQQTYHAYLENMRKLVVWLTGRGYEVRLLQGDGTYDPPVIEELLMILKKQGGARAITSPRIATADDLIRELSMTDVVISPRFHNLVLGLMLGKPVVSLSYSHKHDELLKDFGLADRIHPLAHFDFDRLLSQFSDLLVNFRADSARIAQHVTDCRRQLDCQYTLLLEHVGKGTS